MGSRLFWRLFLTFWSALVLFGIASLWAASHYLDRLRKQEQETSPMEYLIAHVQAAQTVARTNGLEGLKKWALDIDRSDAVPLFLLDRHGVDILEREVPGWLLERFRRYQEEEYLSGRERHHKRTLIYLEDGGEYRLMPNFQDITLGRILSRPRVMTLPLLMATLVGGLVCFLLTRHLTDPVIRLRQAAERYTDGHWEQRVAPSLGKRRDELFDLAMAFDQMAERLGAVMQTHRQLLSDVSHELRSPLARLQAALGLARQRAAMAIPTELDRIEREVECLNELIGQLLSLAQLGAGVLPPTVSATEAADLDQILITIAEDACLEASSRSSMVELRDNPPAVLRGNPALLHSALENLVRNAVRFSPAGSVVTITSVLGTPHPDWIRVQVRDRGPGVPESLLTRIFEPFVRLDEARNRQRDGGHGLGLAIAQRAIRLHGGEILASNAPSGGLIMTVDLPLHRPSRQNAGLPSMNDPA